MSEPTRLCGPGEAHGGCRSIEEVERWLSSEEFRVVGSALPPGGAQGARLFTVAARDRGPFRTFRAKWRGPGSSDMINEPRKELAAYAVQKLFLDPGEYVAPPTAARCFREKEYREFSEEQDPPLPGADCILGFLSYWLEDVESVDGAREAGWLTDGESIWSPRTFETNARYRTSIAQANLFMFVINHGDAHRFQFMLERFHDGLRTYVVDNSISFRSLKNPLLLFQQDWSTLLAPAFPARTIERLRSLRAEDFDRLGLLEEFVRRRDGSLTRREHPSGPPVQSGLDWDGQVLRIGLTPGEIELVRTRIAELGARSDWKTF